MWVRTDVWVAQGRAPAELVVVMGEVATVAGAAMALMDADVAMALMVADEATVLMVADAAMAQLDAVVMAVVAMLPLDVRVMAVVVLAPQVAVVMVAAAVMPVQVVVVTAGVVAQRVRVADEVVREARAVGHVVVHVVVHAVVHELAVLPPERVHVVTVRLLIVSPPMAVGEGLVEPVALCRSIRDAC